MLGNDIKHLVRCIDDPGLERLDYFCHSLYYLVRTDVYQLPVRLTSNLAVGWRVPVEVYRETATAAAYGLQVNVSKAVYELGALAYPAYRTIGKAAIKAEHDLSSLAYYTVESL